MIFHKGICVFQHIHPGKCSEGTNQRKFRCQQSYFSFKVSLLKAFRARAHFWVLAFVPAGPGARHDVNGAAELPRCSLFLLMTLTFIHLLKFWWGAQQPMSSSLRVKEQEPTGGPVRRTEVHKRHLPLLSFLLLFCLFVLFSFDFSGFAAKSVLCRCTGR